MYVCIYEYYIFYTYMLCVYVCMMYKTNVGLTRSVECECWASLSV